MRIFTSAFITLFSLASVAVWPSVAQTADHADGGATTSSSSGKLDSMYDRLVRTRDPDVAAVFAKNIDDYLDRSPSATVSLLLKWSDEADADGRDAAALDFLSEAIALRPDEPAAFRKRALLHYTHGDFNRAMDDIRSALALEPRDFAGLGLMATILDRTGRQDAALKVWRRYLEFYPADRDVGYYLDISENELAGDRL